MNLQEELQKVEPASLVVEGLRSWSGERVHGGSPIVTDLHDAACSFLNAVDSVILTPLNADLAMPTIPKTKGAVNAGRAVIRVAERRTSFNELRVGLHRVRCCLDELISREQIP